MLFLFSGANALNLFSNTFGTALLGLSVYNAAYIERVFAKSALLVVICCSFIGISFYLGFWEINDTTKRFTFIDHNQNTLSFLMCIGVSFIFFFYHSSKNRKIKTVYLLLIFMLIIPILSTISRTGIVLLIITLVINIYFVKQFNKKITIVLASVIIGLTSTVVFSVLDIQLPYFQQFSDRTAAAEQDSRIKLWSIGGKLASDNLFTGVGFNNFKSDEWRKSVGLIATGFDESTGKLEDYSISIHNSFLDLILIGGIFLVMPYCFIILNLCYNGYKLLRIPQKEPNFLGAFILSTTIGIILFSFTGQAATFKFTWYLFAVNYYLIYQYAKKYNLKAVEKSNKNLLMYNRG